MLIVIIDSGSENWIYALIVFEEKCSKLSRLNTRRFPQIRPPVSSEWSMKLLWGRSNVVGNFEIDWTASSRNFCPRVDARCSRRFRPPSKVCNFKRSIRHKSVRGPFILSNNDKSRPFWKLFPSRLSQIAPPIEHIPRFTAVRLAQPPRVSADLRLSQSPKYLSRSVVQVKWWSRRLNRRVRKV